MIKTFLPDLVTAVSDCVQPVSDQCLAKGLIPDPVYRGLLESRESSDNKARTLLLAIRTGIKNNSNHLEIFLNILVQQHLACDKLLSDIRKTLVEKTNTCSEVVLSSQNSAHLAPNEQVPRETALLQSPLLDRYEESIRQHERACAEKAKLEATLNDKSRECERLKEELEVLKRQTSPNDESRANTQSRLTTCESEVETLKTKVCELENATEGYM